MSTIKSDRIDYEKLLNGLDPVKTSGMLDAPSEAVVPTPRNVSSAVDSTTPSETMKVQMFSFDYDATKYHIDRFYSEYGISNPSGGQGGAAAPEPRTIGGGVNPGAGEQKKTYTYAEYNELRKKAHALRDAYDFEKDRALAKELDDAITEGRVKD